MAVAVGSVPTLLVLAAVGNHLLVGDYLVSIILCIILGSIAGMVYLNQNKIIELVTEFESTIRGDRSKDTEDRNQN